MTSFLRKTFQDLLKTIAVFLDRLGFHPNLLTIMGVLGHLLAAWRISSGHLVSAGLLLLFFGLFDTLDGALARYQNKVSKFGAFLDSVCDRFSEGFIFIGFLLFFISKNSPIGCVLVLIAALGAFFVSYVRARAESVGVVPKLGLMTRVERYIVLVLALLLDKIEIGLAVIAALSLVTIGQRIWFVHRQIGSQD